MPPHKYQIVSSLQRTLCSRPSSQRISLLPRILQNSGSVIPPRFPHPAAYHIQTQVQPNLTAPVGIPAEATYIALMTYLDVPHYGSTVTLLQWVEPDLTLLPSLVLTKTPLNSTRGAPYIGPAPPPGDPHQYTVLLFPSRADSLCPIRSVASTHQPTPPPTLVLALQNSPPLPHWIPRWQERISEWSTPLARLRVPGVLPRVRRSNTKGRASC